MSQDQELRHEDEPCLCGKRIMTRYICTACYWNIDIESEYQWYPQGHGHKSTVDAVNEFHRETLAHINTHTDVTAGIILSQ